MKDGLTALMAKRMDRRGFLELIGLGLLGFLGVSRFLEAFQPGVKTAAPATSSSSSSTGAYGGNAYGGNDTTPVKVRP